MRVPLQWLQQYVPVEATAQEVGTRLTMGGLEVEGIEESGLGPVLDVYITPNRGDCLSLVGVGREVAALYGLPLKVSSSSVAQAGQKEFAQQKQDAEQNEQGHIADFTSVTVEAPDLCPRYAARLVRGITVGPSPAWMQARPGSGRAATHQ